MQLGYQVGTWTRDGRTSSGLTPREVALSLREAEALGYDSVWVPESYGGEAFSFLGWLGASSERLRLGTHVMPIWGRSPTTCAQAWATLDHLSGGRAVAGLGVSGAAVAEGWAGRRFERPLAQTREYVEVMRRVFAWEHPTNEGRHFPLPVPDGTTGIDRALRSTVRPLRPDLPILLGAMGPRNLALAAEIADGWCAGFFAPEHEDAFKGHLEEGFRRPGARRTWADFEVVASVAVAVDDDLERAATPVRRQLALYISAMGTDERNFQSEMFERLGWGLECRRIREAYRTRGLDAATSAVTLEMVDAVALVGPAPRIRENLAKWTASFITTLSVRGDLEALRLLASCLR